MADRYIDDDEISEYGGNFLDKLPSLTGQSELVDVAKLGALVSDAMNNVETELQKATNDRSSLRTERVGTAEASEGVRDIVSRFYYFLCSQPQSVDFDFDALYPGRTMGDLTSLKPADLAGKASDILRGFETPKNKTVAILAPWKIEIATTHQTLSNAVSGKGTASGNAFVATAGLIKARKRFFHAYNKVAKPIIRGLLASLGRENEVRLFFKDLAVNEDGNPKAPTPPPAPAPAEANPATSTSSP